ncbi:MAG: flagellar basal body-associated FliL family protein [Oligoflexia bacterium]|nr:flagellar basal body-associated FliL family protein [Oligoflexia bacterium]
MQDLVSLEKELNQASDPSAAAKTAEEGAPAPDEPAQRQKKKKREMLWTTRLEASIKYRARQAADILRGLVSPDRPTRWMSLFFLCSVLGVVAVVAVVAARYSRYQATHKSGLSGVEQTTKQINEFLRKQAEDARQRASLLPIGGFVVEFRPMPGKRLPPGAMNMAQLDLVIECDSKETRDLLQEQQPKVRNQISTALMGLDRDEVMTRDGKRKLRKSIVDNINVWLPRGKATDVFLTRFLIN